MKPLVIIINGKGGVGKDTLVEGFNRRSRYKAKNISAIHGIKEAAKMIGWDGGKSDRDRKFLSDLKKLSIDYNDFPLKDVLFQYYWFIRNAQEHILFIHIREPQEIAKCKKNIQATGFARVKTMIVISDGEQHTFGNESDDNVFDYQYDIKFLNTYKTNTEFGVEQSTREFAKLIEEIYESTT